MVCVNIVALRNLYLKAHESFWRVYRFHMKVLYISSESPWLQRCIVDMGGLSWQPLRSRCFFVFFFRKVSLRALAEQHQCFIWFSTGHNGKRRSVGLADRCANNNSAENIARLSCGSPVLFLNAVLIGRDEDLVILTLLLFSIIFVTRVCFWPKS